MPWCKICHNENPRLVASSMIIKSASSSTAPSWELNFKLCIHLQWGKGMLACCSTLRTRPGGRSDNLGGMGTKNKVPKAYSLRHLFCIFFLDCWLMRKRYLVCFDFIYETLFYRPNYFGNYSYNTKYGNILQKTWQPSQ